MLMIFIIFHSRRGVKEVGNRKGYYNTICYRTQVCIQRACGYSMLKFVDTDLINYAEIFCI